MLLEVEFIRMANIKIIQPPIRDSQVVHEKMWWTYLSLLTFDSKNRVMMIMRELLRKLICFTMRK